MNKIKIDDYVNIFPNGIIDSILHFANLSDRQMIEKFHVIDKSNLKTPDKIKSIF